MTILDQLKNNPVIATLYGDSKLDLFEDNPTAFAFLANIPLVELGDVISRLREKRVFTIVNFDAIAGLSPNPDALAYIASLGASGIISTHASAVTRAPTFNLLSIQKVFITDRSYAERARNTIQANRPHLVQIMPWPVIPFLGQEFFDALPPFIASGFINTQEDVERSRALGAVAVSTTQASLWQLR